MDPDSANPILLYDGVCGLCNRLVQFILKRDAQAHFRFAWLQGEFAADLLRRHHLNANNLDTLYLVEDQGRSGERLAVRSDAVIKVLRQLGGPWMLAAAGLKIIPRWLRDWGYKVIARNRYRIFGRSDRCLVPESRYRDRFLDA